jgi:hypothetical protein
MFPATGNNKSSLEGEIIIMRRSEIVRALGRIRDQSFFKDEIGKVILYKDTNVEVFGRKQNTD